jgi:hypothetical protein
MRRESMLTLFMYGGPPEAAVSMLLDESDVAFGKPSRLSRF